MRVLAIIGGMFMLCVFAGALIPGVSYHVYFGTDQGALEWHRKNATDNEAARKQGGRHGAE